VLLEIAAQVEQVLVLPGTFLGTSGGSIISSVHSVTSNVGRCSSVTSSTSNCTSHTFISVAGSGVSSI
jgi:hypothetical protein